MQFVPEWAPNIHPMIVHFPLVLLVFAILFDIAGLILKKETWLSKSSLILYLCGITAVLIAFLTGKAAADSLDIPANVISSVNEHADWAEITLWFFAIYIVIRITVGVAFKSLRKILFVPIVLIGIIGIYFLYQTGDHGAKLVYGYGLGTGNIIKTEANKEKVTDDSQSNIEDSIFIINKNGSWKLIASPGIDNILSDKFVWVKGALSDLNLMYDKSESAIMFHVTQEAMFVFDNKIKSVQVTAIINIDGLNGKMELVHHFTDKNNYDFLEIGNGEISLSRKSNGEIKIFKKNKFQNSGWIEVKVISDGTHFRGYVNNKMIVHGHDSEPEPGSIGIKLSGSGIISIKMINSESLKN